MVFRNKVKAKRKLKDQIPLQTSMRFTHNLLVWPVGGKNVTRSSLSSQFSKTCKITDLFSSLVQKGHLEVLWLNPCSKQGQLDQIAEGLEWSSFKYLQEWKFNNLSGQPLLIFDQLYGKTNTTTLTPPPQISHVCTCVCCLADFPCASLQMVLFHFLHVFLSGNRNCTGKI